MTQIKVAVVTANIGNVDSIKGMPRQNISCDYFYYDENNLPFPLINLSNRLRARYLKAQTHRFLPDYDLYIWMDHRVKIEGNNFVDMFLQQATGHDIAIYKHRERKSVYEELDYISTNMRQGSKYLLARYANQPLIKEALLYKDKGLPNDFPLFTGGFYARWNNEKVNNCFDEWWRRLIEFSYSDQTMMSLVMWQHHLDINALEWDEQRTHKLLTIGQHDNPNV